MDRPKMRWDCSTASSASSAIALLERGEEREGLIGKLDARVAHVRRKAVDCHHHYRRAAEAGHGPGDWLELEEALYQRKHVANKGHDECDEEQREEDRDEKLGHERNVGGFQEAHLEDGTGEVFDDFGPDAGEEHLVKIGLAHYGHYGEQRPERGPEALALGVATARRA